jgi:hypothetical protein
MVTQLKQSRQPLNGGDYDDDDDDDDDDDNNNNNTIISHYGTCRTTAVCPVLWHRTVTPSDSQTVRNKIRWL